MIKKVLFILLFANLMISQSASADHLTNVAMTIEQADGTKFHCLASGDEFYNYLHDSEGFTIVLNPKDGNYYYGIRQGEEVVPSKYLAKSVNPANVGLIPGAKISEKLYRQKREAFLAPMKMKGMTDAPTTGQVNQLSIYISFADDSVFETPRQDYFDSYRAMDKKSLKHYYNEVSYGRLSVDTYHYPNSPDTINVSYISEHPRAYFVPHSSANPEGYTDGQKAGREHSLLINAIEFVRDQIPDTLNLDANNDGNVDNVCFTIKGGTTAWSTLLWPHRWSLYSQTTSIHGLHVRDYLFMLEATFEVSTLCHEFFHVLGAPDLYHYTDNGAPTACGPYDIMDQSSGHGYMGAFMKYKYGDWMTSVPEITESGTYTIYPLQNPEKNIYKISSPLHPLEYFILEYRKKDGLYESNLPGEGLIIYRINPAAGNGNAGGPPDEIYVYRSGGTLTEEGSFSEAPLGNHRFEMSDGTNPSSFLYNNGNSGKGGLDLFNVINYGDSITFEVNIIPLHPPVDLTFNLSESEVSLDWLSLYSEGFDNYIIYKNDERLGSTKISEFIDTAIHEDVSYSYYVTATYSGNPEGESEPSNTISFTPKGIMTLPYSENFEEASHGWAILGSVNGFRWGDAALHEMNTDNETLFLAANSFAQGYSANSKDMAITPRLDLSNYNSVTLGFDYTLKRLSSADFMQIWIRHSPTDSWIELKRLGVSGFGPKYIWRTMSVDIPQEYYSEEVQIGFQYYDTEELSYGTGIDNVLIQGIRTNFKQIENSAIFTIFPNPSNGNYELQLTGLNGRTNIRILDLQGKKVWQKELSLQRIQHHESLNLEKLPNGIYVLIVNNSLNTFYRKLIKQ